ncbi:zonular occludens toxin family protein [Beggiatoa leptomitoformis]|uniref:Zona occludens toxin N-terminal domain-containing protein n=1 Tax=Beggiatoa leptomitoformis TaxID=288004 RepID=A0A2N9YCV7_9GAMM|nr:zonular occludens toxin domain-containing protein [Beggiatoa leptomitoformis]ALG66431.1 hypothetical protein AL038_00090 [Beggiatoa leptomitoformis]AUI68292.1 hypothetical protein BLE401_05980 [Beggiatoa leptomitoformis]
MSITAICGLPRHGKSYQVCSQFIPQAILKGRNVITNIHVFEDEIHAYLLSKHKNLTLENLGRVRIFQDDELDKPNFFPTEDNLGKDCTIGAGDLVVIDEAWKYFDTGAKVSRNALAFLRYHGHFKNPLTGVTCDVVLVTQDVTSLPRGVKNLIELTLVTIKLVEAGLRNAYILQHFQGGVTKGRTATRITETREVYNSDFFKFYKSHDGDVAIQANEQVVDKRQVIWNSKFFRMVIPLVICMFCLGLYIFYRIISGIEQKAHDKDEPFQTPVMSNPSVKNNTAKNNTSKNKKLEPASSAYSVMGYYVVKETLYVWIYNGRPRLLINPKDFRIQNMRLEGVYKEEIIDSFTGAEYGKDDKSLDLKIPKLNQ